VDLSEAAKSLLSALIAADTGTGGFNNSSSNALIQKLVFFDDANYASDRASYNTLVELEVQENTSTIWGTGASTTDEKTFVLLRFTVITQRDPGKTRRDAVVYRMRTQWDGVVLGTATDTTWTFGPLTLERVRPLAPTSTDNKSVLEFSVRAASGTAIELTGRQASVTFAGAEGTAIGSTMFGSSIAEAETLDARIVTRWGDVSVRRSVAGNDARIDVDFSVASMTPTMLTATTAVLVVFEDTTGTKKKTYTNALVVNRRFYSTTKQESQPNRVTMSFAVSAVTEGVNAVVAA